MEAIKDKTIPQEVLCDFKLLHGRKAGKWKLEHEELMTDANGDFTNKCVKYCSALLSEMISRSLVGT